MPETDNPQPRRVEDPLVQHQQPAPIDNDDYHLRADEYMDAIHEKAEQVQEDREDVEVEYSVSSKGGRQVGDATNSASRLAFSP